MFTSLLLSAALLAGADEPIDEVTAAEVAAVIAEPSVSGPVCDSYREMTGALTVIIMTATDGSASEILAANDLLTGWMDSWFVLELESGPLRLTTEARDLYLDWLHESCV